jgi:luciferase family oxidoreductase group 1
VIPFSILDLSPIGEGTTAADAFHKTLTLAQRAEALGYHRFWLAEHHNMVGVGSAATSILIGYVASGTQRIRVGSGGVMLPNHAPLIIAEQFGTLASLYPDRIDLGLGRAPGTDMLTARALRRDLETSADQFPQDVQELQFYFKAAGAGQRVRAVPGAGLNVPIWLLGSSLFSAQLAAALGLPFAFASHFAPAAMMQAMKLYRENFQPSEQLDQPYAMLTVNALAADTDAEAHYYFSSQQQSFANQQRGVTGKIPPPVENFEATLSPAIKAGLQQTLYYSFVGSGETVEQGLRDFLEATQPDELMLTNHTYDEAARLRSLEIIADVRERLGAGERSDDKTTLPVR